MIPGAFLAERYRTQSGTFKEGDLLVDRDGLRIVRQNGGLAVIYDPLLSLSSHFCFDVYLLVRSIGLFLVHPFPPIPSTITFMSLLACQDRGDAF